MQRVISVLWHILRSCAYVANPAPDVPLVVIGDVHGCLELLLDLLAKIPAGAQVVLVGDYIDRGEDSAGVLRFLSARSDLICLCGNHEEMLLRFLVDPERNGPRWLRYGGLQTLESFRISHVARAADNVALVRCRDALVDAMGPELIAFVQRMPASFRSGNVFVSHAGADPMCPLDAQNRASLLWGHPDFPKHRRTDSQWVAYGHVIHTAPTIFRGSIALDTGAYATGRLSAVSLAPNASPVFISAERTSYGEYV